MILPRRCKSDISAIAEAIEKKTSGTTAVKRRFRNISPKGFRTIAFCFSMNPRQAPIKTELRRRTEKV